MTEKYELSRRKTLAGLATIGAAGAGAGLGTSALFSDTESFTNNTITAGTLDMQVQASVEAANEYWEDSATLEDLTATADGEAVTGLQVEDVKPGDWAVICFDFGVAENPAYIQTTTANLVNHENGLTEPEGEVDTTGGDPGEGNGELQDHMIAEVYENHVESDSDDPHDHVSDLDPITDQDSTVQETYDAFENGAIMGGSEDPLEVGSIEDGESAGWCLLLHLPSSVENVVQSDSFSFDLIFEAQQVRNNDDPFTSAE